MVPCFLILMIPALHNPDPPGVMPFGFVGTFQEKPMPTIGPYVCQQGERWFEIQAVRKPVPEENPCLGIRVVMQRCCTSRGCRTAIIREVECLEAKPDL